MALSPVPLRASTSVGSADNNPLTRSNSPALIAVIRSDSVDPMMLRFYLAVPVASLALAMMAVSSSAVGQTAALPEQPLLGSTLNAGAIRDLPTSSNPFAVLETIQAETIGSRVSSGGLNIPAPRFGGVLNSSTQTQFRIGDIAITD